MIEEFLNDPTGEIDKLFRVTRKIFKGALGLMLGVLIFALFALLVFRVTCVTFVDNYNIPYTFDLRNGQVERVSHTGYIVRPPLVVKVHSVDGRPMQVCISAIQRVLNCKLVQFNPEGLELFVKWHGRGDYSNDGGTRENPTTFNQILMAYAYEGSGKNYPFLTVIRELKPEEMEVQK